MCSKSSVCLLCQSAIPSFLEGDSCGPLFCERHGTEELIRNGIVGTTSCEGVVEAPADALRSYTVDHTVIDVRVHPNLLYSVFVLDRDSAIVVFPVGSCTVGAQYFPGRFVQRALQGLIELYSAPNDIRKADRSGILCAIQQQLPITDVTFGQFLDGTVSKNMLGLEFQSSYWLEFDTGNWLSLEPAEKVFFDWRGERWPTASTASS